MLGLFKVFIILLINGLKTFAYLSFMESYF